MIRIGVLTPHAAIGPEEEFAEMAPGRLRVTRVARISADQSTAGAGADPPTTPAGLRALTATPVLEQAAATLSDDLVDVVGYASTTTAYVVGFDEEQALVARLSALLGVPVASTCASALLALGALGVERVALIGAPWFHDEFNELGAAYFRSQGLDVVSSVSADLARDPRHVQRRAVVKWASQHVGDEAEGIFIGGNGFRAARAVQELEATLGRPVLTANQVLLWQLLAHAGARFDVEGYGRLSTT